VYQIGFDKHPEVARLRGKDAFDAMAQTGIRVEEIVGDGASFKIQQPWTYYFTFVNTDISVGEELLQLEGTPSSVIMDCHFPVMRLEHAFTKVPDDMFKLIENRNIILGNLALADAVTVPSPGWAADLVGVNPNVFYLPDLQMESDYYGDTMMDREIEDVNRFIVRLSEAASASAVAKKAKPCCCPKCMEIRASEKVHEYLSVACLHEVHEDCKAVSVCQYCATSCICKCHEEER
jgi:hypothetical protein